MRAIPYADCVDHRREKRCGWCGVTSNSSNHAPHSWFGCFLRRFFEPCDLNDVLEDIDERDAVLHAPDLKHSHRYPRSSAMLHDRAVEVGSSEDSAYLLRWIAGIFYGDTLTAHATNRVLGEVRDRKAMCLGMVTPAIFATRLMPHAVFQTLACSCDVPCAPDMRPGFKAANAVVILSPG